MDSRILPSSQISGNIYNSDVQNGVAARLYAVICKQLLISNDRNTVR
jgi:hypothetical protein